MKYFISAVFLIGFCLASYTQVTISGSVSDENNNPLFGVEIYTQKKHIGTTSDGNGNYELTNVPHGSVEIIFSFFGFEPISKKVDLHDDLTNFNIQMKTSIFKVDEVVISTPFNRLQSENVMKVEIATIDNLKQKGAITLAEGLETIAGVSQIGTGPNIGKPVIRGLSGNRVLVYTQGTRLENQQYGDEHGLGINQAGIESVEVIKGPASLLYGSDALGGVLYFNPEKFGFKNSFEGSINQRYFSNTQGSSTSFGLKQSKEQWKYLVRGTYDTHIDYKIPSDERVTNSRFNELNLNSGIGFNNNWLTSELRYNYNQTNVGLTEGIEEQTTRREVDIPYQLINNHILSLHNHIYFDKSKLDVDLSYSFNDRNEFEEHHDEEEEEEDEAHHDEDEHHEDEPALHMKLKTFQYNVKYHFNSSETNSFILGMQGMNQSNTNYGEELLIPDAQINDIGFFATSMLDLEKISFLAGIRFDTRSIDTEYHEVIHEDEIHVFEALDKSYTSFTASLGTKFNLFNNIVTRLNLASGYRAPNLAELTSNGVHHGTNRFEIGNPNLNNEQNFQVDLALEYQNEHFEIFVNGFYNGINDYIYITPTGEVEDAADVYEYIQDNAKLYGGEFGFHLHPHPLDWLHLESAFETVTGKQESDEYLPLIPANSWKNIVSSEFNIGSWFQNAFASIAVNSYFQQDNISMFETTTDGYTLVNFGFGGDLQAFNSEFELTFNLNNAFDKEYISHLSRLKNDFIPNMGRNFMISLSYNF